MNIRSTAFPCKLVAMSTQCGSFLKGSKAAPPLKSTSTKFTMRGSYSTAIEPINVSSSSDLPEPVVPAITPCTPSPPALAENTMLRTSLLLIRPSGERSHSWFSGFRLSFHFFAIGRSPIREMSFSSSRLYICRKSKERGNSAAGRVPPIAIQTRSIRCAITW